MKTVEVAAAIIKQNDTILATQRGYGEQAGGWEFPGGKLEEGEDGATAIVREIREELDAVISVDRHVVTIEYDYPTFHITMYCYLCRILHGDIRLLEHSAARWLDKNAIDSVDWLPADIAVVEAIKKQGLV